MVAPNKQPSGSKPGPAAPHQHPAHDHGPTKGSKGGGEPRSGNGVAPHGTPKPVGNGKKNPLH